MRNFFHKLAVALLIVTAIAGGTAIADYSMTQGAGTSFGSKIIGGTVHYAQQLICDVTTPAQCAAVSAGGAIKVDNSGVTQPVSGTVTANQGGAPWSQNLTQLNSVALGSPTAWGSAPTGNMTGVNANVLASVLPTGAATAAKQPALGTAGTASSDVLTVQGIASMTALKVDGSAVTQPVSAASLPLPTGAATSANQPTNAAQGSTTAGQTGNLAQAAVTTAAPTYTTAQTSPLSLTTAGGLRVDGSAVTQPVSGTVTANPGNSANTTPWLMTVNQGGNSAAVSATNALKVDGSAVTQPISGSITCSNCSGSGASAVDEAAFTAATSVFAPAGGFFQTTATSNPLTTGQQGMAQMTANRALFSNLRNASGTEIGTSTTPLQVSVANTAANATAIKVDNSAVTQPISGAVTANTTYNTAQPTPSTGTTLSAQSDQSGNLRTMSGAVTATLSAWNSSTTLNSTQNIFTNSGAAAVEIQLTQTTTITGGAINFQVSYDSGSTWVTIPADAVIDPSSVTEAQISLPYSLQASTNKQFLIINKGWDGLRIILSTALTGTGTVTPTYTLMNTPFATTVMANQINGPWTQNLTQVNGVSLLAGNGTTGTGSPRVTIASDNSAIAGMGVGATGSAVPANGQYQAGNASGNLTGQIICDNSAVYDASTSGSTQLVGLVSGKTIYVCGYSIGVGGTATNVKLIYGTGTACATGSTNMTPAYQLAANGGVVDNRPYGNGLKTAASNELCINASAANAVQAVVYYTQF